MNRVRIAVVFYAALCATAFAQSNEATPPVVIGMNNFIHATGNLEKTTAFYRDIFGLEEPAPPLPPNPAVPAQFRPTIRNIFGEDPDGFEIELYQGLAISAP
jgi:hypothetical protein